MEQKRNHILYLDDYHAGDVLFLQSLAQALAKVKMRPVPIVVHGSAEAAERLLEAKGIFRRREAGVIPVESIEEHRIVEQAARRLNQHIVAVLNDAVVATVGVFGTQRGTLLVRNGQLTADRGAWVKRLAEQGIVPVLAAFARDESSGRIGEVPLPDAVCAVAKLLGKNEVEVVFFTKTNLPGVMGGGKPLKQIDLGHSKLQRAVSDQDGLERVLENGLSVLLTNTTRLADPGGPVGTTIQQSDG